MFEHLPKISDENIDAVVAVAKLEEFVERVTRWDREPARAWIERLGAEHGFAEANPGLLRALRGFVDGLSGSLAEDTADFETVELAATYGVFGMLLTLLLLDRQLGGKELEEKLYGDDTTPPS